MATRTGGVLTGVPRPHVSLKLPKHTQGRGLSREMNRAAGTAVTSVSSTGTTGIRRNTRTTKAATPRTASFKTSVRGIGAAPARRRRRTRTLRRG
jgi:hypothetical protein